jgi:hypothetical protein
MGSRAAVQVPASMLAPPDEQGQVDGRHEPAFHKVASATSLVFWCLYGASVLTACALFFLYS